MAITTQFPKQSIYFILLSLVLPISLFAWGPTGHRVVGEVASIHLKNKTKRKINKLLKGDGLALVSTYADEIKSDRTYDEFYTWHYVNFEPGAPYDPEKRNPKGDLIYGIEFCKKMLNDERVKPIDQAFYLKLLVHLVGDLHQPLHVGKASDKGGNDIKLKWFREGSNLHRVWDENLISYYKMSYTELADNLPKLSKKEKKALQQGELMDWVLESKALSERVYTSAKIDDKLWYPYAYEFIPVVRMQLLKGGLRLASVLNRIYC